MYSVIFSVSTDSGQKVHGVIQSSSRKHKNWLSKLKEKYPRVDWANVKEFKYDVVANSKLSEFKKRSLDANADGEAHPGPVEAVADERTNTP